MRASAQVITGRILTGFVGVFLIGASGIPKFIDWPGKGAMTEHLGLSPALLMTVGVIEIVVALLYLIPRTSFLGAILLSAYLGGAVVTHLRIGDPWWFPVLVGVLAWSGLALRQPLIIRLAFGSAAPIEQPGAARS